MAQILVTGAGGYIGSRLVPHLLAQGHGVIALDRFFFGRQRLPVEASGLALRRTDIRRLAAGDLAGVEAVIDLAALSNDASGARFAEATWAINYEGRARLARLAKEAGVGRYILASSCSVYGQQPSGHVAGEDDPVRPLTTYAEANARCEDAVLPLAESGFTPVALRQATAYGVSPRMRFDLALNGMVETAWRTGQLPLMRDGSQWRPLAHVDDLARALALGLEAPAERVAGGVFNAASAADTWQIAQLGEAVAARVPGDTEISWYGDPDQRSYCVATDRLAALGWQPRYSAAPAGIDQLAEALAAGRIARSPDTITLDWYAALAAWHAWLGEATLEGKLFDL